jgi:hypothetical protein
MFEQFLQQSARLLWRIDNSLPESERQRHVFRYHKCLFLVAVFCTVFKTMFPGSIPAFQYHKCLFLVAVFCTVFKTMFPGSIPAFRNHKCLFLVAVFCTVFKTMFPGSISAFRYHKCLFLVAVFCTVFKTMFPGSIPAFRYQQDVRMLPHSYTRPRQSSGGKSRNSPFLFLYTYQIISAGRTAGSPSERTSSGRACNSKLATN